MSFPIRSGNPETSRHAPPSHPSRDTADRMSLARAVVSRKRVRLYDSDDDPDDVETSDRNDVMFLPLVRILTDESPGPDGMNDAPNVPRAKAGAAPQTTPHADREPPISINNSFNNSFNGSIPAQTPSSRSGYSSESDRSAGTPPVPRTFNSSFNNYQSLNLNNSLSNSLNHCFSNFDPAAAGSPDDRNGANNSMALERTQGRSYR